MADDDQDDDQDQEEDPWVRASARLPRSSAGERLDRALAELWPEYSRARLQQWIRSGALRVDGRQVQPRLRVLGGEWVELEAEPEPAASWVPQDVRIDVIHEDADLIVVDKPAGLVVHPGAGNRDRTLVNGLLARYPELERLPRAGIVHRLDKDTSGLLVVARSLVGHTALTRQLADRSMGREYLAICEGVPTGGFSVDAPIGRDPRRRLRQAVDAGGRPAVTHVRVEARFRAHALLRCRLETGRTHQIRVHMKHVGHPLVGDALYGGRGRLPPGADTALVAALRGLGRQALHASELHLRHPDGDAALSFRSPLPRDLVDLLALLRQDAGGEE